MYAGPFDVKAQPN